MEIMVILEIENGWMMKVILPKGHFIRRYYILGARYCSTVSNKSQILYILVNTDS